MQNIVVPEEVLLSAVKHELPRETESGIAVAVAIQMAAWALSQRTAVKLLNWVCDALPNKRDRAHYEAWRNVADRLKIVCEGQEGRTGAAA